MIVDNALYHQGKRVQLGEGDDQSLGSARVPCDPGDFQWIGIHDPSPDELDLIARTFDLHPLAVEDAGDSHQRPKLEHYDDTLFLVLKTLWYVDEVEESVFSPARTDDSTRIYVLKREIAEVRRAVMPLREPMRKFAMGADDRITPETATYFRDVADHLHRVSEVIDNLDGLLSTAFDAHLARISVQQNEDMRKISAGAALVVVPTLIAGIYGMNFDHIPELHWTYGYPFALFVMVAVAGGLFAWFKKSGWL